MRQQYPFRVVDNRFLKDYQYHSEAAPLESLLFRDAGGGGGSAGLTSFVASRAADSFSDWQRVAGLVQSPVSANSEGSSTSTPDQCPASPALTFCEMPSSRNGTCCNNSLSEMQQQHVWKTIPSQSGVSLSSTSQLAQQLSSDTTDGYFRDQTQPAGAWNSLMSQASDMSTGALVSRALMGSPQRQFSMGKQLSNELQMMQQQHRQVLYPVVDPVQQQSSQVIKKEEEYFLGGRNGLIIDEKLLSLQQQRTGSSSNSSSTSGATTSSRIGNFMDLLRQSDRPITDATAAASCSHLSQLLTGQEAPEMWIAHSNRLPAMLSEVLPASTNPSSAAAAKCSTTSSSESLELRNKRKAAESSTSDVDVQDRGSTVQHRKSQDEDQPPPHPPQLHLSGASDRATVETTTSEHELFSKRPKIENSNFPFKMQVRKEKLGERISALQQLVSPFGKTDTASVLLEAIGYIKFLHEQVQVLSSPYMKHTGIRHAQEQESKHDLRSRGLCLVPVSCTLRVANDNGADYWTPTLHGGLK